MVELLVNPKLKNVTQTPNGHHGYYQNLFCVVTQSVEKDSKNWLHASVSRRDKKIPTYAEMMILKELCIGDHRTALQVFSPKNQHVDHAGPRGVEVLHLWSCLDGDVTPDFRKSIGPFRNII